MKKKGCFVGKFFVCTSLVAILFSSGKIVNAQPFTMDNIVANAGLGIGWSYSYFGTTTSLPALSLSLEKGIYELPDIGIISVGGIAGFKSTSYKYSIYGDNYKASWTDIVIAARGAIHVDLLNDDKLDTYGGLALGLRFQSYKNNNPYDTYSYAHPLFVAYLGARYYLAENIGVFGELGYGLAYLTVGASFKIK